MMEIFSGFSTVCSGICIGTVEIELNTTRSYATSGGSNFANGLPASTRERYLSALLYLKQKLSDNIRSCPNGNLRDIMECQLMILEDEELADEVETALANTAADAATVTDAYTAYAQRIFGDIVHGLFAFRAEDLICLGQMISDLMREETPCSVAEGRIVFCDHVRLSHVLLQPNIVGIAEKAHIDSTHASALLKARSIPTVQGVHAEPSWQGKRGILDAGRGRLILEPTEQVICAYRAEANLTPLNAVIPQAVPQGAKILATINSLNEARTLPVISDTSVDVGLVRTEMLFLNRPEPPSENEQYRMYLHLSNLLPGRMLTFRSFDFGGDKFDGMPESWRLRGIAREQKGVLSTLVAEKDFRHQIRAILRLSRDHRVRILFPYITDSVQLSHIGELLDLIYMEEEFSGLAPIEKGFMIENTAALAIADEIIASSDFVSVGTNDLLKSLFPSVLTQGYDSFGDREWSHFAHIIQELAASVHAAQKKLILCGEVIRNSRLLPYLDSSGIDYVSLMTQSVEAVCQRRSL